MVAYTSETLTLQVGEPSVASMARCRFSAPVSYSGQITT